MENTIIQDNNVAYPAGIAALASRICGGKGAALAESKQASGDAAKRVANTNITGSRRPRNWGKDLDMSS